MKITLNKSNFEIVLNNFQSFLDKRDSSQITSHIYLETTDDKLLLKATDYEISIQSKIDILQKHEDGIATIEGKKIVTIIKQLKDGEVTLESKDAQIFVKQGKTTYKLATFNASEYHNATKFPEIDSNDKQINLDSANFIDSLRKVAVAAEGANKDNHRVELTGTLLDVKDYQCNFVATDTRRLAIIRHSTQSISDTLSLIIPKRAIMEITKLFYDEFEIFFSETMLFVRSENYVFSTKLINGKYPDYEKIIPKDFAVQLKLPKNEIIEAIKLINSLATKIKITIDSNGLFFESMSTEDLESANTQLEISLDVKEELTIGMDSRYVLDFLAYIQGNEFEILLNDANMPFLLKDENYSTIVMPVII